MDVPDWDLLAVVRGCTAKEPTIPKVTVETTVSTTDVQTERRFQSESCGLFGFQTQKSEDLQDLCRPFCTADGFQSLYSSSCATAPVSAARSAMSAALQGGFVAEQAVFLGQQQQVHPHQGQVIFGASSSCSGARSSQTQKSKKRKNLMKKVCHVPAEGSSSDMWSWRKYGQKPIKGSPYPRGYYRCSSSKGCLARKQVERDKSDPKMFIVTYTSDHNHPMPTHRNSLAGSTRQKPTTAATATATTSSTSTTTDNPTSSSPTASLSPLTDSKTEEDTEMGLSELMKNDDFFVGFEELDGSDPGDCFSDQFSPPEIDFPWLTGTSATASTATAAGGSC